MLNVLGGPCLSSIVRRRRFYMVSDEQEIHEVHSAWIDAVNAGDLVRLLTLMADDVVFINPAQAPFGRDGFSAAFSAAHQRVRIRCISELEEVVVVGEVAYTRSRDVVRDSARRRGSDAARRTSYHCIPQTARWPLAPGPRCPHFVSGGEMRSRECH